MLQTLSFAKNEHNNFHQQNHTNKMSHAHSDPSLNDTVNNAAPNVKSPLDQLIYNLKHNPNYAKEITLGKLVGFYRIGSEIGTGNFSQVKLGLHLLTKGLFLNLKLLKIDNLKFIEKIDKVAVKILDKTKLDDKTQRLLLREITSMEKLHHPNIIRLYEVIHRPTRLYICMEWAPEGELYTRIVDQGKMNEVESRYIFSQIISAVNHMHKNNICHRDIKAENIFFSNLAPYLVKVGDFGFSINAASTQRLNTYCGSPPYAAPELFRDDSYIGIFVDIWALGILLYFMVTSSMPFRADTVSKLKRMILNGDYTIPSYLSDSCQLLIKSILKPVPSDRFNIKEIIDSAWLDGEEFARDLDSYQISNNIEKSIVKREETKAKENLDKLGITRDILICCNLAVAPDHSHPQQDYSFNINNNPAVMDKNINLLPIPIVPNNSVSYFSALLINQAKNINIELKQSINGTYRILFHKTQKELRREFNSDQMLQHNNKKYTTSSINKPNGHTYDYNKNTNDTESYYDNNSNDFEPKDNSSSNKSVKKNSITNENKSIFVKANNNESSKNVFLNNQSNNKQPAVNDRTLPMPPPHHSNPRDDNPTEKVVHHLNRVSLNNHKNKEYSRRSSYQANNNISKNHKSSNNYYSNNDKQHSHSSKFCNIL